MIRKRFPALHYRDFRLWWAGQFISTIGSQMQIVAVNWHIYLLTHSAFALGIIGLLRFLPLVLCSFIAGVVTDRYNRKFANLAAQIVLTFLSLLLAGLTILHLVNPLVLYVITFLYMAGVAFEIPTRQAFIPSLVKREHLANAISLDIVLRESGTIIGPAIAGFAIAFLGVGSVYVMNVISYLAIIISLLLIKEPGTVAQASELSWGAVTEALRFIFGTTVVWSTMILDFVSTFFGEAMTLLPIFATDILHVGPQGLGILYAMPSVGAVLAGFVMAHKGTIAKQGKLLLTAIILYGIGTILFGLSSVFLFSALALFIVGVGDSVSTVIRNTMRQTVVSDRMRGRMVALNMIFFMGGPQLGEFEAGFVAGVIGAPASVVIGGIGVLVIVIIMGWKIPTLRIYDK